MLLPHETLDRLAREDRQSVLTSNVELLGLPHIAESLLLREHGPQNVALLRLYVDGVPYQGRARKAPDSVLCFFFSLMRNEKLQPRHLITCVRKQELCRTCGCRGRCTVNRILSAINWSVQCLRTGQKPLTLFDGTALDPARTQAAGQPLAVRADLLEFAADWAELAHTLGFKPWNSARTPCSKCKRTYGKLHCYTARYGARSSEDYAAAVNRCRLQVTVSREQAAVLQAMLFYDHRKGKRGSVGRALRQDACGLRKGDRLEPGGDLVDSCADLTLLSNYPATLVFWRANTSSFVSWACPLLDVGGTLALENVQCDLLHTVDAGLAQHTAGQIFGLLISCNAYQVPGRDAETRLKHTATAIEARYFRWCDQNKGAQVIEFLTPGVLVGADLSRSHD